MSTNSQLIRGNLLQVFLDLTPSHMCVQRAANSRKLVVAGTAVVTRRSCCSGEAIWRCCNHFYAATFCDAPTQPRQFQHLVHHAEEPVRLSVGYIAVL